MSTVATETVYATVESSYSFRASNQISNRLRTRITAALGYDPVEASAVPEAANVGEGCGNPLLIASLSEVRPRPRFLVYESQPLNLDDARAMQCSIWAAAAASTAS